MAESIPQDRRYTESDEWVRREGDDVVIGITAYAAEQLGDVVYLQLPESGKRYAKGDSFGEIESVKAVSDLYCPLSGTISAANQDLDANPALVNEDPYGQGWFARLTPDTPAEYDALLDAAAYQKSVEERG